MKIQSDKKIQFQPIPVDLGLSVKWASCNLGAISPEGRGDFFAWGEVVPKEKFTESTYLHYDSQKNKYIIPKGFNISSTKYDAATHLLGEDWRLPTEDEFCELMKYCKWELMTLSDVLGFNIVGPNGNSIFLPITGSMDEDKIIDYAAGNYWSATLPDEDYMYSAFYLCIYSDGDHYGTYSEPEYGMSIRPVYDR